MQAQIKADEEKKAAEEKEAAEKKAAEEKEAAEKKAAEEKEEAAKKAAEEKAAAEKALKEALEKKKQEEAASSKPSGGGGTTSKPSGGGSSITSPGDKGDTGSGGWKDYPGNVTDDIKQYWYERMQGYIGKPEPGAGHEIRDDIYGLMDEGTYVQIEWNNKLGVWEAQDDGGTWKLIDPITGGSMSYAGAGLPQRY